jgi:hypothetical protein
MFSPHIHVCLHTFCGFAIRRVSLEITAFCVALVEVELPSPLPIRSARPSSEVHLPIAQHSESAVEEDEYAALVANTDLSRDLLLCNLTANPPPLDFLRKSLQEDDSDARMEYPTDDGADHPGPWSNPTPTPTMAFRNMFLADVTSSQLGTDVTDHFQDVPVQGAPSADFSYAVLEEEEEEEAAEEKNFAEARSGNAMSGTALRLAGEEVLRTVGALALPRSFSNLPQRSRRYSDGSVTLNCSFHSDSGASNSTTPARRRIALMEDSFVGPTGMNSTVDNTDDDDDVLLGPEKDIFETPPRACVDVPDGGSDAEEDEEQGDGGMLAQAAQQSACSRAAVPLTRRRATVATMEGIRSVQVAPFLNAPVPSLDVFPDASEIGEPLVPYATIA